MSYELQSIESITFLLGFASLIGLFLTIYYGQKVSILNKKKRSLAWSDLQVICDSIAFLLKKDAFVPEVILCPGLRGAILAELLINKFERNIPIFVGISYRDFSGNKKLILNNYKKFYIANDWDILIPDSIFTFIDKKILIVDDFCLTGEFFMSLRKYLVENGFSEEKIRVFCSVITKVTKIANRQPEYYSLITEDDFFYFPWGKANMG